MGQIGRNVIFWLVLVLLFISLYKWVKPAAENINNVPYSQFLDEVQKGIVTKVEIEGSSITYTNDGKLESNHTIAPKHDGLIDLLHENNVKINVKEPAEQPWYLILI